MHEIGRSESAHSGAAGIRTCQVKHSRFGRSRGGGWNGEKGNRVSEARFKVQRGTRAQAHGHCHDGPGTDGPQVKGVLSSKDDGTGSRGGPVLSRVATACKQDYPAAGRRESGSDRVPKSGMALPVPPGFLESSRRWGQLGYCDFSEETKEQRFRS